MGIAAAMPLAAACSPIASAPGRRWESWQVLRDSSLSEDGRMIDRGYSDLRTTSEGQSYALFFALVDGDRETFDRILAWTQNNLAGGDMAARLPAWLWGRQAASGEWRVLDDNPASDSDLWLAYAVLEGARLWQRPELQRIADGMLARIRELEITELPELGAMLLPGPHGFVEKDHWRLNPSYLPIPLLRRFATHDHEGPWAALAAHTARMLKETAPYGFAPDWTAWRSTGFFTDPVKGTVGSYDAIRTYLWAGMTHRDDPACRYVLRSLQGPLDLLRSRGLVAEEVDTRTGQVKGEGPYGFHAALLPYLKAQGENRMAMRLRAGLPTPERQRGDEPAYYSHMLSLFGSGWFDGRYRFGKDGELSPAWAR